MIVARAKVELGHRALAEATVFEFETFFLAPQVCAGKRLAMSNICLDDEICRLQERTGELQR